MDAELKALLESSDAGRELLARLDRAEKERGEARAVALYREHAIVHALDRRSLYCSHDGAHHEEAMPGRSWGCCRLVKELRDALSPEPIPMYFSLDAMRSDLAAARARVAELEGELKSAAGDLDAQVVAELRGWLAPADAEGLRARVAELEAEAAAMPLQSELTEEVRETARLRAREAKLRGVLTNVRPLIHGINCIDGANHGPYCAMIDEAISAGHNDLAADASEPGARLAALAEDAGVELELGVGPCAVGPSRKELDEAVREAEGWIRPEVAAKVREELKKVEQSYIHGDECGGNPEGLTHDELDCGHSCLQCGAGDNDECPMHDEAACFLAHCDCSIGPALRALALLAPEARWTQEELDRAKERGAETMREWSRKEGGGA